MSGLSQFPIAARWPAKHPDRLQLYSWPTPNGVKVSIALEEIGLPYEAHAIDIGKNESWTPAFLSLNPNGKIPAIIDPNGPGGAPLGLFESGAILVYLAEKTGMLLPADAARRYETIQWVFFQMAAVGPMFGQVGYFHKFAGREIADKRPLGRYVDEVEKAARRSRNAPRATAMDDGRRVHDRRYLPARLGAQSDRLLWRPRPRRIRCPEARAGLARARPGAPRRATRSRRFRGGHKAQPDIERRARRSKRDPYWVRLLLNKAISTSSYGRARSLGR